MLNLINESRDEMLNFFGETLLESMEASLKNMEPLNEEATASMLAKAYQWLSETQSYADKKDTSESAMKFWSYFSIRFGILGYILAGLGLVSISGPIVVAACGACIGMLITLIAACYHANDYDKMQLQINNRAKMLSPKIAEMRREAKDNPELLAKLDKLDDLLINHYKPQPTVIIT
jgi:hypothetical protein